VTLTGPAYVTLENYLTALPSGYLTIALAMLPFPILAVLDILNRDSLTPDKS